ncbi:MAG: DivIVA domain-containing protein [Pseudarthrobacter sp.]|nr:DivIVA domain-containing protein [Pseudarthrobacter sp.]NUS35092.1 DivIVA domain-containing protein [Pseudarthrobacter sp.]
MSFFLVFLAVVLVAAVLWAGLGRRSRKPGDAPLPVLLDGGFEEPPANLPPVLLPADAGPEDINRVRFSLGLRGYRMDQVDQVLDELRDQLAARDTEVAQLRAQLAALRVASDGGSPAADAPAGVEAAGSPGGTGQGSAPAGKGGQ